MGSQHAIPSLDFATLARIYQSREASPLDIVEVVLQRIAASPDPAVWIHLLSRDEILGHAQSVLRRREVGENLPLFGLPFAIKDSIDLAGCPTTAACPAYSYVPERSSLVVERLLEAGAIPIGKANLDQFGTGLAGDRSPYGACQNVFNADYISGGSSSGSAVAVAAGLVSFALGTDTAGSGRVPAAANNIVGLKPAPGRLSTSGMVPSCASIDCISFLTLTAADSARLLSVAQNSPLVGAPDGSPALGSFAAPGDADLDFCGDSERLDHFRQALGDLERLGGCRQPLDFAPFREVGSLLYGGPWVAERLAAIESFLAAHPDEVHPVTREIISAGKNYTAVDVFRANHRLEALRERCLEVFQRADVLVVPSIPTLPTRADVSRDSIGWSRRLGTYTNFVNLLGLAAIALPCPFTRRGLPTGITLIGTPGSEPRLCEIGARWQSHTDLPLGATRAKLPPERIPSQDQKPKAADRVRVAVAGAHLQGQPLHPALCQMGARFVRACRTAARYRFFAFLDLDPPRPGLLRCDGPGGQVAVEIYEMPMEGFGRLVASVAPPLAIGTVDLEDGESVKGFLCESSAARHAKDITEYGGWLGFRAAQSAAKLQNKSGNHS